MIFSKTKCPLCEKELIHEKVPNWHLSIDSYKLIYCTTEELTRSTSNTITVPSYHYVFKIYNFDSTATMIIPPYELRHSEGLETTKVYSVGPLDPPKYIFSTRLLDMDYSKPQVVVARLKLLVTFS